MYPLLLYGFAFMLIEPKICLYLYFLFFKKKPTICGVMIKKSQILLYRFVFIIISITFIKH